MRRTLPGLLLALTVGAVATVVARSAPVLGAPVVAVALGVLLGSSLPGETLVHLTPGARFAGRYVLQGAIVLFGLGLSLRAIGRVGVHALPVMIGTLAACLGGAWLLGRLLRTDRELTTLIGVGTGICGASAIAATAPVIEAGEAATAYAISTIMVYNVTAAVVYPILGHLLGMSAAAFGLWSGTAVNDTSSVVAAAASFGGAAARYAIVVKLTRTLMIIPIVAGLALRRTRRVRAHRLVPPFLVFFLLAAAVDSVVPLPAPVRSAAAQVAGYGVAVALAGVGMSVRFADLRRAGLRPLALGGVLSLVVGLSGLALQTL
ncbi:MAG TPA: putative sulfate exporter family transporter [Micromonosporaceae bacterium]